MFFVSGNTGVGLEDRTVRIIADGERYEWQDHLGKRQGQAFEQTVVAGQIGGVRLRVSQLEQIVNAASVKGSIGGRSFELDEGQKAELKKFLSALQNPATWRANNSS